MKEFEEVSILTEPTTNTETYWLGFLLTLRVGVPSNSYLLARHFEEKQ